MKIRNKTTAQSPVLAKLTSSISISLKIFYFIIVSKQKQNNNQRAMNEKENWQITFDCPVFFLDLLDLLAEVCPNLQPNLVVNTRKSFMEIA